MRAKHIKIDQDSELLSFIYQQVDEKLIIDNRSFLVRIWTKFVFYFSLTIFSYSLLYTTDTSVYFVLSYALYGLLSLLFVFNFSHDFSHNTIFKSRKLNTLSFNSTFAIVGAHAEAWKVRHINAHHYAPNVENYDPDLKITKLIRLIPNSEYQWYHKFQHIYAPFAYTTYSVFWVFIKDFVILFSKDDYSEKKDFLYHLTFWLQKLVYMTLILVMPLLFSGQVWYIVLTGFLFMHLTQSLFLLFTFLMTHHVEETEYPTINNNGLIKTSWLMNQIKSSNDIYPFSEVANFIFGGFNNHTAHHLFPHYHHIHYPKINRILYGILSKNGIKPNQTTYWGGLVSHLKHLKRMSHMY
jgi:linoleoyl-CoA desaturase